MSAYLKPLPQTGQAGFHPCCSAHAKTAALRASLEEMPNNEKADALVGLMIVPTASLFLSLS